MSFKGDELEWLGWRNQVGGLNAVHVIYENWGVDKLNSFVLFASCGSRLTRMQTTDVSWSNVTFHFYIYWSEQLHITLKLIKKHKHIQVSHDSISINLRLSSVCLLIPVVVGSGTAASPPLTCWWLKVLHALLLPDRWGLFEGIDESSSPVMTRPLLIWETHS